MSAKIIDGKKAREALIPKLIEKISSLKSVPGLAIVQVGNREDSNAFIRAKNNFAKKIGVNVVHEKLDENVIMDELLGCIEKFNNDEKINGIILQLPLPLHLDKKISLEKISPKKDVDALTEESVKNWTSGKGIMPATARGIKELFNFYEISLSGKNVCVIGRSDLVGKPIASMCQNAGAIVTVCHKKTIDIKAATKAAEIIIVAAGSPKLITKDYVNNGQVIIDVGINTIQANSSEENSSRKLVGDVDFDGVKDIVSAISPVPGGVGPMTILALFENLVDLSL